MHSSTIKLKDGRVLEGVVWDWHPEAGWFTLVHGDETLTIQLDDCESAVTHNERVSVTEVGVDVDLLAKAKADVAQAVALREAQQRRISRIARGHGMAAHLEGNRRLRADLAEGFQYGTAFIAGVVSLDSLYRPLITALNLQRVGGQPLPEEPVMAYLVRLPNRTIALALEEDLES